MRRIQMTNKRSISKSYLFPVTIICFLFLSGVSQCKNNVSWAPTELGDATYGEYYKQSLQASPLGGCTEYSLDVVSGRLPNGIKIIPRISSLPSYYLEGKVIDMQGLYNFTLRLRYTDKNGKKQSSDYNYSIKVKTGKWAVFFHMSIDNDLDDSTLVPCNIIYFA